MSLPRRGLVGLMLLVSLLVAIPAIPCGLPPQPESHLPEGWESRQLFCVHHSVTDKGQACYDFWFKQAGQERCFVALENNCIQSDLLQPNSFFVFWIKPDDWEAKTLEDTMPILYVVYNAPNSEHPFKP